MSENENSDKENERVHSGFTVSKLIEDIKKHLGIVLVAEAGHGKSFTAFTIVKEALKDPDTTVIVFSPSTIWRRKFGSINCVQVGTSRFNPIVENNKARLEPVPIFRDTIFVNLDKKWLYRKSLWLEQLLRSQQSLLFEIKYRNGRRIKAFESLVLQIVYEMQEHKLEDEHYHRHYLIVLEEVQNAFGTYSLNSDDSLELFTIFTQSRSDAQIHYIAVGQRLNDISTKVIERLRPVVGLTLGENSLRKIKAMIPENLRPRIQNLPSRTWIYLDGETNPEFTVEPFTKTGKATMLKPTVTTPKRKKPNILSRLFDVVINQRVSKPDIDQEESSVYEPEDEKLDDELEDDLSFGVH